MFYIVEVQDYVRVEPRLFGLKTSDAVAKQLQEIYANYHDKEIGEVISIISILEVGDGIIIPGDGSAYYNSRFKLLVWKPELQELVFGVVEEITNFGAFMNLGVMKGMIHISQTMDDYVTFSSTMFMCTSYETMSPRMSRPPLSPTTTLLLSAAFNMSNGLFSVINPTSTKINRVAFFSWETF